MGSSSMTWLDVTLCAISYLDIIFLGICIGKYLFKFDNKDIGAAPIDVNPLMHNVPKWSDILLKSCSKYCKILKVCLNILGHYALNG